MCFRQCHHYTQTSCGKTVFHRRKLDVVCIKHFVLDCIVTVDLVTRADGSTFCLPRTIPKLTDDVVPSIFNSVPKHLSSHPAKKTKTPDERRSELDLRDHQVLQNWYQLDEITSFNDLSNKISEYVKGESNCVIITLYSSVCCCITCHDYFMWL